eukprot:134571_1
MKPKPENLLRKCTGSNVYWFILTDYPSPSISHCSSSVSIYHQASEPVRLHKNLFKRRVKPDGYAQTAPASQSKTYPEFKLNSKQQNKQQISFGFGFGVFEKTAEKMDDTDDYFSEDYDEDFVAEVDMNINSYNKNKNKNKNK